MTAAILTLLGAIVPFALWLWKRRAAKRDDPLQQHREHYERLEKPLPKSGSTEFAERLAEYERLRRAKDRPR